MVQFKAKAALTAYSSTFSLSTGRVPGRPMQTGSIWVFGGAPKAVALLEKILERVLSWQCTSSPITASYCTLQERQLSWPNEKSGFPHSSGISPAAGIRQWAGSRR
jgi:hypothetical protein